METVYNEKWCKINLHKQKKRMYQTWLGRNTLENFKEVVDQSNELLQTNKIESCLTDMTNKENGSPDEKYYAMQLFPMMQRRGLHKLAIILSQDKYVHDLAKEFAAEFDRDIVSCFTSVQEAESWLDEKVERRAA